MVSSHMEKEQKLMALIENLMQLLALMEPVNQTSSIVSALYLESPTCLT